MKTTVSVVIVQRRGKGSQFSHERIFRLLRFQIPIGAINAFIIFPVEIGTECNVPPMPEHAVMAPKYNGAILMYFCEPGYTLIGPSEIFCDGRQWNGTTPYCRGNIHF